MLGVFNARYGDAGKPLDNETWSRCTMNDATLKALKIAFTYMPKPIEVTKYEYGDRYQKVLDQIAAVREILLLNEIDPEEVYGEINPETTPNSSY
jgi:hypothetical protein